MLDLERFWAESDYSLARPPFTTAKPRVPVIVAVDDHWLLELRRRMMATTRIDTPYSRVRVGLGRADITPPVGIYHRLWGAARHDRAAGVHRPIIADAVAVGSVAGGAPAFVRIQTDLAGLNQQQNDALAQAVGEAVGIPSGSVIIAHSHSHSSGWFTPDRISLPGGELIEPYLADLRLRLVSAARQAVLGMRTSTITYAVGSSAMAGNRDYPDEANGIMACGYNPDAAVPNTLVVASIAVDDSPIATIVQYGCHPTTLAWENQLISPDYIGALRETVEMVTRNPCLFMVSPCGDLGPRHGFVGDTAVADRNGRQVAYDALALLESMPPPLTEFTYAGPVVSGATLGIWRHEPLDDEAVSEAEIVAGGRYEVDLPLKPRPEPEALLRELAEHEAAQRAADARRDVVAARDHGARAERARRWLRRIEDLPDEGKLTTPFWVHRLGGAFWVAVPSEPYSWLYEELRLRFPGWAVLCSPLASALQAAYLMPRDRFGLGLYQEEPSSYAPGALEELTDAIAARMATLIART